MRPEILFEKFDVLADAPNAVANIRELILELAVQGKLTDQRPKDYDKEWVELTQHLNGDSEFNIPEKPFKIPPTWKWTSLVGLGETKPRNDAADKSNASFLPMASIPAEYGRTVQHESRLWGEIKKGYTHVQNEDVVVAKITPCFENGKSTVLRDLTEGIGAGTTELHVFRPRAKAALSDFVLIFLKTRGFIKRGIPQMTGSAGQKRVPYQYFANSPFPLPPLAEQKRIVEKVDELMALCDRLEAQQQERETREAALARASLARFADAPTPASLNLLFHKSYTISPADLRKTILTLAVQGKLVPQDAHEESAEQALAKVLRCRKLLARDLRIKEISIPPAGVEYMPRLPSGWVYASPDQLMGFHKNALTIGPFGSSLLKSDYRDDGVPLVFVRDIRKESFGGPETRFVSVAKADELASHTVKPGDLLITKMGDPPGDTAIYPIGRPPAIITADCIKLTPHRDLVIAEYLRLAIRAPKLAAQFAGITAGVAQQKVSLARFRGIAVPLPPLAEQRRIVPRVDQLMALVDQLETQLAASAGTGEKLMEALVAELTEA